jgi:hypothetical protein
MGQDLEESSWGRMATQYPGKTIGGGG